MKEIHKYVHTHIHTYVHESQISMLNKIIL